jgi:hypothetical protein
MRLNSKFYLEILLHAILFLNNGSICVGKNRYFYLFAMFCIIVYILFYCTLLKAFASGAQDGGPQIIVKEEYYIIGEFGKFFFEPLNLLHRKIDPDFWDPQSPSLEKYPDLMQKVGD